MRQVDRLVGWVVSAVLLGAACAPTAAPAAAPTAPSRAADEPRGVAAAPAAAPAMWPQKITIAYSSISGSQMPIYLAADNALFAKHGLDVEVMYVASGTSTMQSLVSGDMQFVQTGGTEVPSAALGGAPVKMLVGWINVVPSLFMVEPSITTPEQLRGKAIGITKFGAQTHSGARLALRQWGLNPDTDVRYLQLGGVPEVLAGMESGAVQGGVYSPPTNVRARKLGYRVLGDLGQMGIPFQGTGLIGLQPYVDANQEVVRRAAQALGEGIKLYLTDDAASRAALAKFTKTEDPEQLDESIAYYRTVVQKVPYPSVEGLQTAIDDVALQDPRASALQPRDLIDTRALEQLEREGYFRQLWGE
jgi:NitT/TauT family transport system substrate-binding protein